MSEKLNPLFVDSTKGFGESVGTRIELTGVTLKSGETVHAKIRDNYAREQIICLEPENESYVGRIWLTHQQMIVYEFFIASGTAVLSTSAPRQIAASHMIIDQWHPDRAKPTTTQPAPDPVNAAPTRPQRNPSTFAQVFPETETFGQLIDKWGL